ncbi:MAG: hypothetical protein IPJ48_03615 [Propionivibrio sp.]|uniref:Uncharacterized protein n=1 Tax=Candidatus Propionivibrio dominans TaxID=2954373 RepID=A0A9D7F580_9RHOO|nr:hypothetical protein [Candidatus Propionivibrio dominans]
MQLDIFEHSRDVVLRNAAMDALRERDTGACAQAVATLAAEYSTDPLLPPWVSLCEVAFSDSEPDFARGRHGDPAGNQNTIAAAAHNVFGRRRKSGFRRFGPVGGGYCQVPVRFRQRGHCTQRHCYSMQGAGPDAAGRIEHRLVAAAASAAGG